VLGVRGRLGADEVDEVALGEVARAADDAAPVAHRSNQNVGQDADRAVYKVKIPNHFC